MNISNSIYRQLLNIRQSIAFYPAIIALAFLFLSFFVMYIEHVNGFEGIKDHISFLLVKNLEDARLILGKLVGSIISLMVFSFSMVMVVLNSASTAFSPRVIPGLITNKAHQIVLGIYLGTILFSLLLIININKENADAPLPSVGVLFSMIFGVISLSLFIYFIHSISKDILVDNILDNIYETTRKKMSSYGDKKNETLPDFSKWSDLRVRQNGYFKQIKIDSLLSICNEHDCRIYISEYPGYFCVSNFPLIKISRSDIPDDVKEDILNTIIYYPEERLDDHYHFGCKQISEVAVKALSPGINDPGTASKAIDMLTILLIKRMELNDILHLKKEECKGGIFLQEPSLDDLLFRHLSPIRHYGKEDNKIMMQLMLMVNHLLHFDHKTSEQTDTIIRFGESIRESCEHHMQNQYDLGRINVLIEEFDHLKNQT